MKQAKKESTYFKMIKGKETLHKFAKGDFERYEKICLSIWGGTPLDLSWATNTNSYKQAEKELFGEIKEI